MGEDPLDLLPESLRVGLATRLGSGTRDGDHQAPEVGGDLHLGTSLASPLGEGLLGSQGGVIDEGDDSGLGHGLLLV